MELLPFFFTLYGSASLVEGVEELMTTSKGTLSDMLFSYRSHVQWTTNLENDEILQTTFFMVTSKYFYFAQVTFDFDESYASRGQNGKYYGFFTLKGEPKNTFSALPSIG